MQRITVTGSIKYDERSPAVFSACRITVSAQTHPRADTVKLSCLITDPDNSDTEVHEFFLTFGLAAIESYTPTESGAVGAFQNACLQAVVAHLESIPANNDATFSIS